MTPAERRALIGDAAVEDARRQGREAIAQFPPTPDLLARLRLIFAPPVAAVVRARDAA